MGRFGIIIGLGPFNGNRVPVGQIIAGCFLAQVGGVIIVVIDHITVLIQLGKGTTQH